MNFKLREKLERLSYIERDKEDLLDKGFVECCSFANKKISCFVAKGTITSEKLTNSYSILIFYHLLYPYKPPIVFPLDKTIINNRHQDPSYDSIQGKLCLYNISKVNDWNIGTSFDSILDKTIEWFFKYENCKLKDELAPPEMERYHPKELKKTLLKFLVIEELQNNNTESNIGKIIFLNSDKILFINHLDTTCFAKYDELLFKLDKSSDKSYDIIWFDVKQEPFPILRTSLELYKFISRNAIHNSFSLEELARKLGDSIIIALRYKFSNKPQWIFYYNNMKYPKLVKGHLKGFRTFAKAIHQFGKKQIQLCPNIDYLSYNSIFKRNNDQFENMLNKKVLILGIGTIGSRIAELLVKSGIKSLDILDNDVLKVGNICRHILSIDSIGKSKVEEVAKHLLKINPFLDINPIETNIMHSQIVNYKMFSDYDLIISCIGDNNIETFISKLCCESKKDSIFIRSYLYSSIGEIIYYKDGYPCFSCVKHFTTSKSNTTTPKIPIISFGNYYKYDYECGTPFMPAAAVDIDYVSLVATQLVLEILNEKTIKNDYYFTVGRISPENKEFLSFLGKINPYSVNEYNLNSLISGCYDCKKK